MRRVARLTLAAVLLVTTLGCTTIVPPASPHPGLVQLVTSISRARITPIDPSRLAGAPIGEAEAVRRAATWLTLTGVTAVWPVEVEMPNAAGVLEQRLGWAVVRGDPRDPDLKGDQGIELEIIDATTGQPLLR